MLREFIRLPSRLYRGHSGYVAPLELERLDALRQDKNPYFKHAAGEYWLALRDGKPVGRISAAVSAWTVNRAVNSGTKPPLISDSRGVTWVVEARLGEVDQWCTLCTRRYIGSLSREGMMATESDYCGPQKHPCH